MFRRPHYEKSVACFRLSFCVLLSRGHCYVFLYHANVLFMALLRVILPICFGNSWGFQVGKVAGIWFHSRKFVVALSSIRLISDSVELYP